MTSRVLVVDDAEGMRRLLAEVLGRAGFEVVEAAEAERASAVLAEGAVDLVLLDLGLPGRGGLDLLAEVRQRSTVPVIVLSGRAEDAIRVRGLELGADDYVVKPFLPQELVARIHAVLRRTHGAWAPRLQRGDLVVDRDRREVTRRGDLVRLRAKEFDLLAFLAASPGRVFTYEELLAAVWRSSSAWQLRSTVTEHIRRLRLKVEDDPSSPRWILTVRGIGYVFSPDGGPRGGEAP